MTTSRPDLGDSIRPMDYEFARRRIGGAVASTGSNLSVRIPTHVTIGIKE
jgi:hypothetical protein